MAKETRKIVNCDLCGRDTKNKCRVCRHCSGGHQQPVQTEEDLELEDIQWWLYREEHNRDDEVDDTVFDALDDMLN